MHMRASGRLIPYRHLHIIRLVERLLHIVAGKPSTCEICVTDMQNIHATLSTIDVDFMVTLNIEPDFAGNLKCTFIIQLSEPCFQNRL